MPSGHVLNKVIVCFLKFMYFFIGLLETFAALARRRTLGSVTTANVSNANANNTAIVNANTQNNQNSGSLFPRGPNSVSSLVRLALSSNFPGGLLSTAQSYPSLSSANNTGAQQGNLILFFYDSVCVFLFGRGVNCFSTVFRRYLNNCGRCSRLESGLNNESNVNQQRQ